jgi:hypothetical protein
LLDDLLGARWEGCANLGREVEEALVAGELLQAGVHQAAGGADIATQVRQLGLQEPKFRPAKSGVAGQPVEAIFGLGVDEPVEQQAVPFGQRCGALVTVPARGSPGAVRSGRGVAGEVVERVKVAVGESDPHVGRRQHLREHAGQRGFPAG